MKIQAYVSVVLSLFLMTTTALAEDKTETPQDKISDEQKALFKKFEETLSGAEFSGNFTIVGKDDAELKKETYLIKSVTKLPKDDYWLFRATIRYGDKNVTLPIPLQVKWAGDTPMITLTDVAIPTLGTFSSRVVIYNGKYAGTWTHGKVHGHLFGTISKPEKEKDDKESP